jgi:long-chain acyl-CoA synthetase
LPGGLCLWTRERPRHARDDYGAAALVKLTSGSTDFPRAALTEEIHLWNDGRHVVEAMGIGPDDVNLACIPLAHSYGLGNLVMPLVVQGTAMALRESFTPTRLFDDAIETGASVFPGVPFMFDHLCTSPMVGALPPSLRLAISAGARLEASTVRAFHQKFERKIHSFYGSSETGGIAYDDSLEIHDLVPAGRPMPETDVSLRPHEQADTGGGRIHVAGNAVTAGYAGLGRGRKARALSPETGEFADGGFLTGDLGRFDHSHRLLLTGRISAFVNIAGRKVDPREVERVLLAIPGVAEARVFGVACDRRGEKLVACIVARDPGSLTPGVVRKRCADRLSPHKIPRDVVFLEALPVTSRGKLDRRELEVLVARATT